MIRRRAWEDSDQNDDDDDDNLEVILLSTHRLDEEHPAGGNRSCGGCSSATSLRRLLRKRWVLLLLLTALVVLARIIDFLAILEYPDPIASNFEINNNNKTTTLILMLETRQLLRPPKTVCINRDYASRHGYDFELVTRHECFDKCRNRFQRHVHLWCRPLVFKDALKRYDQIFYLDSDAYFVRPDMSIEAFFQYARDHDYFVLWKKDGKNNNDTTFVGAQDCGTYFSNGGIQFWRKTAYTDRMLTTWFLLYRRQFIFYWLRIHWLPNYEIHYFSNREQGSFKVAVEENEWMRREVSLIRYGKETWHLPYNDTECLQWPAPKWEDSFYLNHIVTTFGAGVRRRNVERHIRKLHLNCT